MAKKILVIDDNLFIREVYEDILNQEGYDVDSASDGEEGLQKLQKGGYDLTLLDVNMPKLDGLGILKSLLEKPSLEKNGPIILLTNSTPDAVVREGLKIGASSYFIKADLAPDQLLNQIKQQLSG